MDSSTWATLKKNSPQVDRIRFTGLPTDFLNLSNENKHRVGAKILHGENVEYLDGNGKKVVRGIGFQLSRQSASNNY